MRDRRFQRLTTPTSPIQAHISPDSHYVLLPVIADPQPVEAWVVYDVVAGAIVPNVSSKDGRWSSMHEARQAVEGWTTYPEGP